MSPMPTYSDEAVVLRTHDLAEADRIVTLLTRRHGKVRAVAKGVRRTSSKFGARLEPFSQVDLQLVEGRSLQIVAQAMTRAHFGESLVADYSVWTTGQVMLETADKLVVEDHEPALQQYLLLVGALRALAEGTSDGPRPPRLVLDSYLLRSLSVAGYAPTLTHCSRCGVETGEFFNPASGGVVCFQCRPGGSVRPSPGVLPYLSALLTGDWPATRDVTGPAMAEGSGMVAAFVSWHVERGLRSLAHVDRG